MKDDGQSFAEAVNRARQLPDDPGVGAQYDLPQLFSTPFAGDDVVDTTDEPAPEDIKEAKRRIGKMPVYNLQTHFKRFVMGPIVSMSQGQVSVDEQDDTAAYEEVQNACLKGKAILCWERTNFLKDGAVVIAMKWLTRDDGDDI